VRWLAGYRHQRHWNAEIAELLLATEAPFPLCPLFWTHVNPYGRFELDMNTRLDLGLASAVATVPSPRSPHGAASSARS
jgi:hypothetical protein